MITPNPKDDRYLRGWTDGKKEANELKAKQVEELNNEIRDVEFFLEDRDVIDVVSLFGIINKIFGGKA